ncbi:MAG: signal peptidase I [Chloroflexi bacterium]|nr:MAG: signal peptidase I [Chloroflexota bacterium]
MRRSHLTREIVEIVALTLFIFVAIRFTVQSYYVKGLDMQPELQQGTYVLVNKLAYHLHRPERGDVIVFHNPQNTGIDLIKRVIGTPGDTIAIDGTHVWVNDRLLNEPYITTAANPLANRWTVPPDKYFVMGDNRPVSDDSRIWSYVPNDFIIGKAVLVYWPFGNYHAINTYSNLFAQVKSNR